MHMHKCAHTRACTHNVQTELEREEGRLVFLPPTLQQATLARPLKQKYNDLGPRPQPLHLPLKHQVLTPVQSFSMGFRLFFLFPFHPNAGD